MNPLQKLAASALCAIFVLMVLATFLLPTPYARQFRDIPTPILRSHILLAPMHWAAIPCLDCSTAHAFPCSSRRLPLFFRP